MTGKIFNGFPKEFTRFFADLAMNNTNVWFKDHKHEYEEFVLEPSRLFVMGMGERLTELSPNINAIPSVNKSLFRLNRDTRFSKDKSPYKTNLGILFWEGSRKRMECPGFYFHVEAKTLMLGGGIYMFPKDMLESYRKAVIDKRAGKELSDIVKTLKQEKIGLGGAHYKRVPQGYDPDHENYELLKHNGLYTMVESTIPEEFSSDKLIDYCFERYEKMHPLHKWILKNL